MKLAASLQDIEHLPERELLELAALAAGYSPARATDDGLLFLRGVATKWDSIKDSGDAFALQVALGIAVIASKDEGTVTAQWGAYAVTAPATDNVAMLMMARRVVTLMAAMIGLVIKRAMPPAN